MSLVEALQVSPARSRRRKKCAGGMYSPKMSGGVRVEVTLLDGRKLEFSVGARLLTQDLMSLVTSHFSLCESHYFALAYRDTTGHCHWLLDDRRLLDHDFARGVRILPLHFLVRFFPESITELRDAQTVELFYQHAINIVGNGELEVDNSTAVRLAALALQASIGNFIDEATSKSCLKSSILSSANLLEHALKHFSEEKVVGEHQQLIGLSRGDAILSYMRQIECIPGYGVHFYEVRDRSNQPWQLGISQKGILQYEFKCKKKPKRVFFWKQLENLYFRERKFSIEVHDPKRVVLALNSFNLYEGAIEDSVLLQDDLLEAITEDTTQVSVSRRTFGPGNVSVCVWFAETQSLCKSIWSMAIAQHQFYLDRKTSRTKEGLLRVLQDPPDLAGELSRSCISLSTHSSSPNLSRSGSHSSLQHNTEDSASTESLHAARMEMLSALQQRYDSLHEKLEEKSEELRLLCLREGELTGELPPEYPKKPGEQLPVVRKRVGTSFSWDEALINKIINKQEETVASLELEYEIQAKIVSAGLRLANESSSRKGLRKQRKHSYYQASQRLLEIEQRLRQAKNRQAHVIANNANTMPKMKKKPRPVSDSEGLQDDNGVIGPSLLSSLDSMKETSFIDGVGVSPSCNSSQSFSYLAPSKSKSTDSSILHSAPPSPQRNSLGQMSTSDCSSGLPSSTGSRSNSPARPSSGYIPSVVYTRNQYRAQHYPTLSTRGQSMPSENLQHQRSFNGGLYNLPQQRTSLASHSLDDLDSSNPNSPLLSTVKTPSHNHLPPHPHNSSYSSQPQTPHTQTHNRRPKNESHDRFGSLDRRRATSGRFESRSMEHLDSLPSSPTTQTPTGGVNLSYYSPHPLHDLSYSHDLSEGQLHSVVSHSTSQCFSNSSAESPDIVDGFVKCSTEFPSQEAYSTHSPQIMEGQYIKDVSSGHDLNSRNISQRLHRSQSGRGYASSLEASVPMAGMESHFKGDTPHFTTNQENIPPSLASQPAAELLPPLRASNHRHPSKREGYSTNLRPTASVNAADHLRPFRIPATDLPPLRPTKSSSELPPLKPTNGRMHNFSNASPYYHGAVDRFRDNTNDGNLMRHRTPSADSTQKFVDCASNEQHWASNGAPNEPLMSLAEGAWLKKEQRIRNDSAADGPKYLTESNHCQRPNETKLHDYRHPSTSHSVHNLSTSSSGSSGSVFHSTNEGSDSLNSTLNTSSLNASLNATLTVISAGSFQPSREVSKPFEMSDFYKYSTKFRRKSSTGGSTGQENGIPDPNSQSTNNNPLSPHLPPKMSMLLSSTPNTAPPSPSIVAQNSSPAPQQKGLYQPLTPLTCKPLDEERTDLAESHMNKSSRGSWDHASIHQAVPVNVTTKRSATLV